MIRDICGDKTKEAHLLIQGLNHQVPSDLLAIPKGSSPVPALERLRKRLEDNLGLADAPARWTVQCWALALSVVTEANLKVDELPEVLSANLPQNPRADSYLKLYDDAVEQIFRDIGVVATGKDGQTRRFAVPLIWADEQGAIAYVLNDKVGGVMNRIHLPLLAIHSPRHAPDASQIATPGSAACRIEYTLFAWTMFHEDMTQIVQGVLGKFASSRKAVLQVSGVAASSELVLGNIANNLDSVSQGPVGIIKYRFDLASHALLPAMGGASSAAPPIAQSGRASASKRVSLEDVLLEPDAYDGQFVQIKGEYAGLYTGDSSFKLEQGDHEIWVFYSELPRDQKSVILCEGEANGRAVIVEGVLHCGDVDPLLTASRVAIQGMKARLPSRSADGSIELAEILLDPGSFNGQQIRMRGTYGGLYTSDSSFKLEQGNHEIWVFYSQLPREQKSMILRESEADERVVIVEGVLECSSGDPRLTASTVAIEGMAPKKSGARKNAKAAMPDWDGCGPCSSCRTVINMTFDNAVCPICGNRMSWQEAFQIAGSYSDTLPRDVYSERDLQ